MEEQIYNRVKKHLAILAQSFFSMALWRKANILLYNIGKVEKIKKPFTFDSFNGNWVCYPVCVWNMQFSSYFSVVIIYIYICDLCAISLQYCKNNSRWDVYVYYTCILLYYIVTKWYTPTVYIVIIYNIYFMEDTRYLYIYIYAGNNDSVYAVVV